MPMKRLSSPFYTLLLPVFFILHIVNEYYALLPAAYVMQALLYDIILSLIVVLTGKMIFRSPAKAGIWATCLLIVFFFFGAFHDLAKSLSIRGFLVSYKFLLPLIVLGGIFLTVYIKRTGKQFNKLSGYLATLFTLLVAVETVHLLYNLLTHKEKRQIYAANNISGLNNIPVDRNNAPDIFFIVLDEFCSSAALEKYFHYRNTQLDSSLTSNDFFIVRNSKSNYNNTPVSIASTLDLQYFDLPLENKPGTDKEILREWYTLKMNHLPGILKKAGYEIHNYGVCDFENYPSHADRYFSDYERQVLHGATLWGRIKRDILWNVFSLDLPFFINKKLQKKAVLERDRFIANNRKNLQLILRELNRQGQQPKFVFGHMMMPHAPFYLDRQGRSTNLFSPLYRFTNTRDPYLDQLIYTNTWVDSLAKAANQPFTRPRVVIIEGDHGYRDTTLSTSREMHFMNLNSWYFSDKNYSMLYDSVSPVNSFRIVFNKYFNTHLPLLKDSTIRMK